MFDLAILHLSDLHIGGEGKSISKPLNSLLLDIKTQVQSIPDKKLAIVVTGDTINIGDHRALENAKTFFRKLKDTLGNRICGLYIVPGNHDKTRTTENEFLIAACRKLSDEQLSQENVNKKEHFDQAFEKTVWPILYDTYKKSGYVDLIRYIYSDLFNDMNSISKIAENTYGVHILEVEDKKYCFVMLNTAWSCADDQDTRQLILGQFQLANIIKQFHNLTDDTKIDITFVLGHHPIECFSGSEQDKLFAHMISYTEMNANIYMCGHTHDRNVINWSNSRHAIHTLMTGFGWPEKPSDRVHDHYYSLYLFDLSSNSVEIYVRRTNDGSSFIPDLSIYTGQIRSGSEAGDKLVRPLRFEEGQGAILLSTANGLDSKTIYVSNNWFDHYKEFQCRLNEISFGIAESMDSYKSDLFQSFLSERNDVDYDEDTLNLGKFFIDYLNNPDIYATLDAEKQKKISKLLSNNEEKIFDNFQAFFQKLCQEFHECLVDHIKPGQIVRFHFRYLSDRQSYNYSTLCSSFSDDESCSDNHLSYEPSDIKYGDLILEAFQSENTGCLIYTSNEEKCQKKLNKKWKDFITVVPKFDKNVYVKKVNQHTKKRMPFITFGVTINSFDHQWLLQCMDFCGIDKYLSLWIQRYCEVFKLDIDSFLNWLKKQDKMEA